MNDDKEEGEYPRTIMWAIFRARGRNSGGKTLLLLRGECPLVFRNANLLKLVRTLCLCNDVREVSFLKTVGVLQDAGSGVAGPLYRWLLVTVLRRCGRLRLFKVRIVYIMSVSGIEASL